MKIFPPFQIDFYKSGHMYQYPEGTELVFSNFTPRSSRLADVNEVVFWGLQYFSKEYLIKQWNENFFLCDRDEVCEKYEKLMFKALGKNAVTSDHLRQLHRLGYLPISIMALPEGSRVPLRIPMLVIWNTHPSFYWLTNNLETIMSTILWGGCTSATMALEFRKILDAYADMTVGENSFVDYQGHDFSCRGMFGLEAACISGMGHALSFVGTDSVPAIDFIEQYYPLWDDEKDTGHRIGESVPATEHSVMSLGSQDDEIGTIRRLITEVYPTGTISIVCDTWDFFKVVTEYLPILKDEIMARDGKVVIRPDSGDPADIICGDRNLRGTVKMCTPEAKGAVECLWNIFGGTITDKGYRLLDSHIGLIYGDSITRDRCANICRRLSENGFASTNVVFGIGSYTYQYTTRDTFGFAVKATYAEVNGEPRNIFKKPKTDDGTKNSATGLLAVYQTDAGCFWMKEKATWDEVNNCAFEPVFLDGVLLRNNSLSEIRDTLRR